MKIGKESEKLEFKKTTSELKAGVISMVAILNKHGGGELYFGIRNDGTPAGQMVSDKTLRDISQAVSNHIEPQIFPEITEVAIDDKPCICIEFSGDDAPYFAYGRAYVRVADEDKVMSPAELEEFILRKNASRDAWDGSLSDKSVGDISQEALQKYLECANQAGRIDFSYTTEADALNRLCLNEDGKLKNVGAVLFCGNPLLEVQMAIFATTERLTFNDIKREGGNVLQLVEIAEKYIRSNIRWRVVLDGSLQRKEIPEIPMNAVREALVNSYCHRDFKSSQNNEITIYSNRVEIYNPGKFPDGLTPQNFIEGSERSVKRNPLLAQLMYYSKDIESFGTGLRRITAACESTSVKVEFQMLKNGFAVVFYRSDEICTDADVGANVGVNETQQKMLELLKENPHLTAAQLGERIGITKRRIESNMTSLKKAGLLERIGSDKTGYWLVKLGDS